MGGPVVCITENTSEAGYSIVKCDSGTYVWALYSSPTPETPETEAIASIPVATIGSIKASSESMFTLTHRHKGELVSKHFEVSFPDASKWVANLEELKRLVLIEDRHYKRTVWRRMGCLSRAPRESSLAQV